LARRLADQYLRAPPVAPQDQLRAQRSWLARVAEDQVTEFERAVAFEMRDAPRDAQRHDLAARGLAQPPLEGIEIERMVPIGNAEAHPLRRLVAADVARGCMNPVEEHPPLDPIARVDDVETVGRGDLGSDGRAGRSVRHGSASPRPVPARLGPSRA